MATDENTEDVTHTHTQNTVTSSRTSQEAMEVGYPLAPAAWQVAQFPGSATDSE